MPQMSPISWTILYVFFTFFYLIMCVEIYFKYSINLGRSSVYLIFESCYFWFKL